MSSKVYFETRDPIAIGLLDHGFELPQKLKKSFSIITSKVEAIHAGYQVYL